MLARVKQEKYASSEFENFCHLWLSIQRGVAFGLFAFLFLDLCVNDDKMRT